MMSDDKWTGKVSADMERIFRRDDLASAEPGPDRRDGDRARGGVNPPPRARTGSSGMVRTLTIAVPLLAIVAALLLFVQIVPDMRPGAALAQGRPAPATASQPARTPAPAAVAATSTPPVAVALNAVAPIAVDSEEDLPAPSPTVEVRRVRVVAAKPAAAAVVAPVPVRGDGCSPNSQENACIYRDVRAADRRLVAAYRDAAEAGVPRGEMIAIRREWKRALAYSLDDPDGTIRIYDELAHRLRDAAARTAGRRA